MIHKTYKTLLLMFVLTLPKGAGPLAVAQIAKDLTAGASASVDSTRIEGERRPMIFVTIRDADTGRILPGRLYLQSESGIAFYFNADESSGSAIKYEKQNWIDKESTEYHTTVTTSRCFAQVPPNAKYSLVVEHGKSYRTAKEDIVVGEKDVEVRVELRRLNDPSASGWYSGDTHIHRSIDELRNVLLAEDLNVALPLTSWVTFSDRPPASGDKNIQDARLSELIQLDASHVIWPRNTEYEIFTVGKKQHTLGALFVLGHGASLQQTVPPWNAVVEGVRRTDKNVLFDMDKLDWPFAMLLPTIAKDSLYELSNNHVWRTKFAFRNWNTTAPLYMQPPYGAQVGGHRQWIDYTHGMYYTLLNCGLRLPPSAGTANGVHPVPAGFGRVYVHLPEGFSFENWMKGLRQGRSFVTTGPMLYATANGHDPSHVFKRSASSTDPVAIAIELSSEHPLLYGEVLVNGRPEHLLRPLNEQTANGAYRSQIVQNIVPKKSGWFAVRFWESCPDGQVRFAHTAPWYVEVDDRAVALAQPEKDYLVDRMRNEITRSNGIVSPEAMGEYQQGLAFYQSLPVVDDTEEVNRNARPFKHSTDRESWLDNMIVDHRFSASEVRMATGLSLEDAQREVQQRAGKFTSSTGAVRVLPYPGGRHPRIGFWDGAIDPQRETKISVFPPWSDGGYVVVDVPEAVFSNLGLTYLAHTHIPTIWDQQSKPLDRLEWSKSDKGYTVRRQLPNGIVLLSKVETVKDGVDMSIDLTNGTDQLLTGLRVQVCTMLKGAVGFNQQEPLHSSIEGSKIAIRAFDSDRWIETQWTPNQRVWTNPPVPCIHSDPIFPDCPPGKTVAVKGTLRFYERKSP